MKNVPRQKLWKQRAIFTMIRPTVDELRVKMHNSRVTLYFFLWEMACINAPYEKTFLPFFLHFPEK